MTGPWYDLIIKETLCDGCPDTYISVIYFIGVFRAE